MNLKEIRQKLEQKKGQRIEVISNYDKAINDYISLQKEIKYSEQARAIIQQVARETQEQVQFHISDIVSMALETIFDKPYDFVVDFTIKRGKTECELYLKRNGHRVNPMNCGGGGVVDVVSFSLRIALWTLQTPRSRKTVVLDEPFKWLSKDLLPRACELLQEVSRKMELQLIIITHLDELMEGADKIFNVSIRKGVSHVDT